MIMNDDAAVEFLEHFGVRGMHWGRRKNQARIDRSVRTPIGQAPKSHATRNKALKIAAGGAVAVAGGLLAAKMLQQHGGIKLIKANAAEKATEKAGIAVVMGILKKTKFANLSPADKKKMRFPMQAPTQGHKDQAAALIKAWGKKVS